MHQQQGRWQHCCCCLKEDQRGAPPEQRQSLVQQRICWQCSLPLVPACIVPQLLEMTAGPHHVQHTAQTSLQTAVTTWCGRTEGCAQCDTRRLHSHRGCTCCLLSNAEQTCQVQHCGHAKAAWAQQHGRGQWTPWGAGCTSWVMAPNYCPLGGPTQAALQKHSNPATVCSSCHSRPPKCCKVSKRCFMCCKASM